MIKKIPAPRQLLFLYVSIALGSMVFSCQEKVESEEKFYRPVKYQEISYSDTEKIRTFSGTAETEKIIQLSFRNTGIITQFNIKLGQKIRKGQLLGRLDNVQSRLAYEQAITSLNSTESQMNTAKLSLNRIRALFEKGSSSLSEFESAKNAYRTAQESFQSAKRGVDIQKDQIEFGYLYAPASGIISEVIAEINENTNPGQTVAILNAGNNMEITLGIPESVINGIKENMIATASFTAIPEKEYQATVTEIAPAVDPNTATYPVRLTINDPDKAIKSGMAADVRFDFGDQDQEAKEKKLIVPMYAVGEDSNGRFVFLIVEEGDKVTIKKHPITIGALSSEGFEVKSGLEAGQKIATAGLQTLLDGQQVKLP